MGDLAIILGLYPPCKYCSSYNFSSGALLFNSLYTPLSYYIPGATYFMGSAMLLAPLILLCLAMYLYKHMAMPDAGGIEGDQAHHHQFYLNI